MSRILLLLSVLLIAAAPIPKTQVITPPIVPALTGNWSGDGFGLRNLSDSAMVQGRCASGKIDAPIRPDASGAFVARGHFNPIGRGYRLSEQVPRDKPATFKGKVSGNTLTLLLSVDGEPGERTYILKRGKPISFENCY